MFGNLKARWKTTTDRYNAFKQTDEYKKDLFFRRQKRKLAFIFLPIGIVLAWSVSRYTNFDKWALFVAITFALIMFINYGAEYLTKKNYKD